MNTTPSGGNFRSLDQLNRDAKRLSKAHRLSLHEARSRIARARGFDHWHHLEATLKNAARPVPIRPNYQTDPATVALVTEKVASIPELYREAYKLYFLNRMDEAHEAAWPIFQQHPEIWQVALLEARMLTNMLSSLPKNDPDRPELLQTSAKLDEVAFQTLRKAWTYDGDLPAPPHVAARLGWNYYRLLHQFDEQPDQPAGMEPGRDALRLQAVAAINEAGPLVGENGGWLDPISADLLSETSALLYAIEGNAPEAKPLLISALLLAEMAGNLGILEGLLEVLSPAELKQYQEMRTGNWEWAVHDLKKPNVPTVLIFRPLLEPPQGQQQF